MSKTYAPNYTHYSSARRDKRGAIVAYPQYAAQPLAPHAVERLIGGPGLATYIETAVAHAAIVGDVSIERGTAVARVQDYINDAKVGRPHLAVLSTPEYA